MENKVQNKLNAGQIVTIELASYYPKNLVSIDLKNHLWQELALKEKDFREFIKIHNWSEYQDNYVGIYCSVDVIIPVWAYMLVSANLANYARAIFYGNKKELLQQAFVHTINNMETTEFEGKRIIIKGCGDIEIDAYAFVAITQKLQPIVRSIAYGEPCSSVPIYKNSGKN